VTVEDPGPSGVFFQEARPNQGSCTITRELRCSLGSLRDGGAAQVRVTATVRTDASGTIANVATVWDGQGDPNHANDTARSTIRVVPLPGTDPGPQPVSDLVITKRASHPTVPRGRALRYTITVANRGPDAAADVLVTDTSALPQRVRSIHPGQGRCESAPPITCALGTLRAGGRTTITIVAVVTVTGEQTNTASVKSASWDPNPASSIASVRTTITTPPPPPRFTG
jgi:uncharacterized repeat protein (TIGR01451 family)